MSQRQFDALTRALAAGASRRELLKLALAGLGSLLAALVVLRLDPPETVGAITVQGTGGPPPGTCPQCGPCQYCGFDSTQNKYRCLGYCGPCRQCAPDRVTCLPKCDACSDCAESGPQSGQCHSRCLTCQRCDQGTCASRCGAGRTCQPPGQCLVPNLILAGGSAPTDPIAVDDDLAVYLNGVLLFQDADRQASLLSPLAFAAKNGDQLRIVATNAQVPCIELSPALTLHRAAGGPTQLLGGVTRQCDVAGGITLGDFYDQTFTISIG